MQIFVDADATPAIAKTLIIKTALRCEVMSTFVANHPIKLPPSPFLANIVVAHGFDVADNYIINAVGKGDLVITNDIVLADAVLAKSAKALSVHGEEFIADTIKSKLNARDFMDTMRATGLLNPNQMGKHARYGDKDKIAFANALNRLVR